MAPGFDIPAGLGGFRTTPIGADMLYELVTGRTLTAVWGGVGSGKSYAIPQLCVYAGLTRQAYDPVAGAPAGPIDILITGRTRSEMMQNLWRPFTEVVEAIGGVWVPDPKWYRWELPNGARITWHQYQCHGDEGRNTLEGRTYSIVISDETAQLKSTFFSHAFERCRRPSIDVWGRVYDGQVFWVGRPAANDAYLREAKRRAKAGADVRILYGRTRDNLWNGPGYLENIRTGRSKAEYEALTQEVIGATYPSKGRIYDDFEAEMWPAGNLVNLPDDVERRPSWVVVDTSVLHTSVMWMQVHEVEGEQLLVVVDEWHPHGVPTSIQDIIAECRARPWRLVGVIIDPAARRREKAAGLTSEVDVIGREPDEDPDGLGGGLGVPVRSIIPTARRGVHDGIMRVKARLCSAAGTRSLVVARRLWDDPPHQAGLRHTVQAYAWDPVTGAPKKAEDCDHADNPGDVLRYAVCHLAWDGPPQPIDPDGPGPAEPPIRLARRHAQRGRQR